MKHRVLCITLLIGLGWDAAVAQQQAAPVFTLPPVGESAPSRYAPAQVAFVQSWIRQVVPDCPEAMSAGVAEGFLDELKNRRPDLLDALGGSAFPTGELLPLLLQQAGLRLAGQAHAALREKIARQRVALRLGREGKGAAADDAAALLEKIREASTVQHRRLLEGRMDDEELGLLVRKIRQPAGAERPPATPAKPKELTATEIVSEFVRRNVAGAALQQMQAYTLEGQITDPTGARQELLLFKMRPDRFRLVMRKDGITQFVIAADADRFWFQQPGQRVQIGRGQNMGTRRYMAEFLDPLFMGEGYAFERLSDGAEQDRRFHRIQVRRPDGSGYVAQIDAESHRMIGRENEDRSVTRYSDFRDVAGITLAFREEATDATGQKSTLVITRITPNPGLIRDLFLPVDPAASNQMRFERAWMTQAASSR